MNAYRLGEDVQKIAITEQRRGLGRGCSLGCEELVRRFKEQTDKDRGWGGWQ